MLKFDYKGEVASDASKFDKLLNESEFGSSKESIMGRRLDMKTVFYLIDDSHSKQLAEIGSIEIKSATVDRSTEIIQLNKNIRVNKSTLCSLYRHSGSHLGSLVATLGLDIIGKSLIHTFVASQVILTPFIQAIRGRCTY